MLDEMEFYRIVQTIKMLQSDSNSIYSCTKKDVIKVLESYRTKNWQDHVFNEEMHKTLTDDS